MSDTQHAQIVIIGGGVIGCSLAYHLSRMGQDVMLLEREQLTHGATWHAAGLVGQLRSTRNKTRLMQKSVELYETLEVETGQPTDWKQVGSLRLACSEERMHEIRRNATLAKSFGLDFHIIGAKEAQDMFPIMSTDNVIGAAFIPDDGYIDPSSVTQALAKGARDRGANIRQGVRVTGMKIEGKRIVGLETDQGDIICDKVINAAGMWGREVAAMAGCRAPVIAVEHQYLLTDPIEGATPDMPTMRDPDNRIYIKPEVRGIAIGGWEPNTVSWAEDGIPYDFGPELLPGNFDRFEQLAEAATMRMPAVEQAGVRELVNGPIPWSADGDFFMGRAPEMDNFYLCNGFSYGIAAGGGAGAMMAEWITEGEPSVDLFGLDVRRFGPHHNAKAFLYPRCIEMYGKYYHLHMPNEENQSTRGIRRSPLYDVLKDQGAVMGSKAGWERPNWFATDGVEAVDIYSFKKPNWHDTVALECKAIRENVALIDMSSFSKFEMKGPDALAVMQRLCIANMDKPVGSVVYTQMCNARGGIEADITICRTASDTFYIVTGSALATHDLDWINRNTEDSDVVVLTDITSARSVINLCGPNARKVLELASESDVSNEAFPFATVREIFIGAAPVRAVRISYVGELGWELHIPTEYTLHVYESLCQAGKTFGITNAGYRAIASLRLEKGYVAWSSDVTPDYTPFDAGLGGRIGFKTKGDFIGRAALEKARAGGPKQKLCTFSLDGEAWVHGGECILHDGKVVNVTTSGGYGHTVGKSIVMGYVPIDLANKQGFEIEAFGERFQATRHDEALYDHKMVKLKM
jgi:sarcosine dehydrogenase